MAFISFFLYLFVCSFLAVALMAFLPLATTFCCFAFGSWAIWAATDTVTSPRSTAWITSGMASSLTFVAL